MLWSTHVLANHFKHEVLHRHKQFHVRRINPVAIPCKPTLQPMCIVVCIWRDCLAPWTQIPLKHFSGQPQLFINTVQAAQPPMESLVWKRALLNVVPIDANTFQNIVDDLVIWMQGIEHVHGRIYDFRLGIRSMQVSPCDSFNTSIGRNHFSVLYKNVQVLNNLAVLPSSYLAYPPLPFIVNFYNKEGIAVVMLCFNAKLLLKVIHQRDCASGVDHFDWNIRHRSNRTHFNLRVREYDTRRPSVG